MIEKTQAIVLRFTPFSNTSRVVHWLTVTHGRITTIIKGSQRPRSDFLGQYDLFYTCELLFYARPSHRLKITRECSPIRERPRLRRDWKAASAASYMAFLVVRGSVPDMPNTELFHFLDASLDHVQEHGANDTLVFWYELKLLDLLGLAPRLNRCVQCETGLAPGSARAWFSHARGGILCHRCAKAAGGDPASLEPDVLATLAAWQKSRSPDAARRTRSTPRQLTAMEALLGQFLSYHLETPLDSRRIALDTLSRRVA